MKNNNNQLATQFKNIHLEFIKDKKETRANYEEYFDDKII
jgi:hypothetical protein